jgi:hypothetical protein
MLREGVGAVCKQEWLQPFGQAGIVLSTPLCILAWQKLSAHHRFLKKSFMPKRDLSP